MINNIIKTGMKKLNLKETFGRENIIESIENMFLKCIRIGRKKIWINPVPSGENMVDGLGFAILTSIKNIMHNIEKRFFIKRKYITERRWA